MLVALFALSLAPLFVMERIHGKEKITQNDLCSKIKASIHPHWCFHLFCLIKRFRCDFHLWVCAGCL